MVLHNQFLSSNKVKFNKYSDDEVVEYSVEQNSFENIPQNRFAYNITKLDTNLFLKLKNKSYCLGKIVDTRN
jgi:hypothetical protein